MQTPLLRAYGTRAQTPSRSFKGAVAGATRPADTDEIERHMSALLFALKLRAARHALPEGAIVLAPWPAGSGERWHYDYSSTSFRFGSFWRSDSPEAVTRSLYLGFEERLDTAGRKWRRCYAAVTDDFGNLVEVPQ